MRLTVSEKRFIFSDGEGFMNRSISDRILSRVKGHGKGWVFSARDFLDLGSRAAVDQALKRLSAANRIRRLARGIYDYPRIHASLGMLSPNPDAVAHAIAAKSGSRIQVSPARAANMLGLSTQVPARLVYVTDGPSRNVKVGNRVFYFKRAKSQVAHVDSPAGVVLQALRSVGKGGVDDNVVANLRDRLPASVKGELKRVASGTSDWTRKAIQRIAG
jgi:Family of unknown function (DUF6088)